MRLFSTFVLAAALTGSTALAQMSSPAPCDGSLGIVRVSDIKAGSMDTFMQAVAAQKAWYASHNLPDKIFVTKLYDRPGSSYLDTQAMTYHLFPTGIPAEPKHDADFDAFVKLFTASSTIKATYFACFPKGAM